MQAIQTRYLRATNTKPSRIKALCERGSLTLTYNSFNGLGGEQAHIEAVNQLCKHFSKEDAIKQGLASKQWLRLKVTGQLPNGDYAHVFI